MKSKILVVLSGLNAGGAETMFINLYRKIDKEKYAFDFLVFSDADGFYSEEIKKDGCRIFLMASIGKSGVIAFYKSISDAIKKGGPYDVIHSNVDYLSGVVLKIARKCGIPVRIAHSHNTAAYTFKGAMPDFVMPIFRKLINRNATKCLACSNDAALFMFGRKKVKDVIIINNAIELDRFTDVGQFNNEYLEEYKKYSAVFLHIGRFVIQKNHVGLISIFSEYCRSTNSNALLLLVGDGELKSDIERLVLEKKLENNVLFLGNRRDIPELMSVADVFLLPSLFEGLPVTLIEAQAMNLPCIVSDNVKHEVDCGLGLISYVSLDNEAEWKTTIRQAICERTRKNNYYEMTECGFNIIDNIATIESIYQKK